MTTALVSQKTAKRLSFALFLMFIALITYLRAWWPGIMLGIGIPLAFRQFLLGRRYDMGISLFVFIGVFITVYFNISWEVLLPILFTTGGLYLFLREYIESTTQTTSEQEEDQNHEIEEDTKR